MITLDEAIKHARDKAEESREYIVDDCNLEPFEAHCNSQCIKCAEEHEQLAQWLEELKEYKELEERGLLVKLPCKVGNYCKDIFLTKEEAEQELKRTEGEE